MPTHSTRFKGGTIMWFKRVLTGALLAAMALAPRWSAADDDASDAPPKKGRTAKVQSGGVIRSIGPDGKVREQRFGSLQGPQFQELMEKLEELRSSSGDQEAVERLTQELLSNLQKSQSKSRVQSEEARELPKFGIGVSLAPEIPAAVRAQLKLGEDEGVLVQSVAKDGPADKAGIREHDVVLAIDGNAIVAHTDVVKAVQEAGEQKQPVSLAVISGGEHKTIEVTPTESEEIEWSFTEGLFDDGYAMPPTTLRMPPGVIEFPLGEGMPRHPGTAAQRRLEERVEKLEQRLEALSHQLDAEPKDAPAKKKP
jgi:hypothetical protein